MPPVRHGQGLDAGVHRLRVQRIAATMCKLGARCAAWLGAPGMNNLRLGHVHAFGGNFLRHVDGFAARLRLVASLRLQRNRGELRLGPEPLWRQHRLGEIETEIFVGLVVVSARNAAPCEHEGNGNCKWNALQDHGRLLKLLISRGNLLLFRRRHAQFQRPSAAVVKKFGGVRRPFAPHPSRPGTPSGGCG
ncbi:hypothetical protein ACVWZ3_001253 [Bradyrhizobium sp. i1.3.6]